MPANIDLSHLKNRSILVVDDNHSIHRDYTTVLCPEPKGDEEKALDALEDLILEDGPGKDSPSLVRNFSIQSAYQGEEALQLVSKHFKKGIRYPLAFIDIQMPPGWDGLETIRRLKEVDDEIRFVIVTAYSDYSDESMTSRVGCDKAVSVIHKPFDPKEVYTLAYQRVSEWNTRNVS